MPENYIAKVAVGLARKNGRAALTKELHVMQVERFSLGKTRVELLAVMAVLQKRSGTENGKNSYKGLWQLHVGK